LCGEIFSIPFVENRSPRSLSKRAPDFNNRYRRVKMPTYLLFLHEDPSVFERVSPEEMQAIIQKYSNWKQRMLDAGALTGGEKLQDGTGRVLRGTGGRPSVTDGPYTESKEIIGGFFEIRAESYEQAVQAASDCPHLEYGAIEIREVEPVNAPVGAEER
jgi:hypothetical protein